MVFYVFLLFRFLMFASAVPVGCVGFMSYKLTTKIAKIFDDDDTSALVSCSDDESR